MKLLDKYHNKFKCPGHSKENTFLRLVGLVLFAIIWTGIWMIQTDSILAGITLGISTTILLDIIAGIGRRSPIINSSRFT